MNLIFMRHGEATDNVKELLSDNEIYWSVLTEAGKKTVMESVELLPDQIDAMYVSPFPRTIQTAHYVFEKYPQARVYIDNRIREIFYGKYSHQKNNSVLDETRNKQIAGDYFVRFGEYGDNKFDIEERLTEFLLDIYNNEKDNTVLVVSHGSVIAYMKRIINVESGHLKKGKIDVLNDVDFSGVVKHSEALQKIKNKLK